jgi:decaprenyl-phosphate phosphoribosyltransferase
MLMRPWQWPKNLLVLAVPLSAGELTESKTLGRTALAVLAMTMLSAATYCGNDARDAFSDRMHPQKKHRPLASGAVEVRTAIVLAVFLAAGGLTITAMLSNMLLLVCTCYLLVQVAYTLGLKHVQLADITCIALGFVLRAFAGGAVTNLPVSSAFVIVVSATSFFVASAKRGSEIDRVNADSGTRRVLATYSPEYLRLLWSSSMTISIIAYVIWSSEIPEQPVLAQLTVAPFALALLRYASHVTAGDAEEPERVVTKDRVLLALALIWACIFAARAALL